MPGAFQHCLLNTRTLTLLERLWYAVAVEKVRTVATLPISCPPGLNNAHEVVKVAATKQLEHDDHGTDCVLLHRLMVNKHPAHDLLRDHAVSDQAVLSSVGQSLGSADWALRWRLYFSAPRAPTAACINRPRPVDGPISASVSVTGMAQGRITPWSGWQEWDTVRKGLLSGNAGSETQSLQQASLNACRVAIHPASCLSLRQSADPSLACARPHTIGSREHSLPAGAEAQVTAGEEEWNLLSTCAYSLTMLLHSDQPSSRMNESILKLQYALCLIRLVNGVTDSAQKGKVASSVSSLASMAGTAARTKDAQASLGPGPADMQHLVQKCQEC